MLKIFFVMLRWFAYLCVLLWPALLGAKLDPLIRVALLKNVSSVIIQGEELRLQIPEEKPVSYYLASPITIEPDSTGLIINQDHYAQNKVTIWSLKDQLTLQDKQYEGRLEIHHLPNEGLLVLNELPLEKYLIGLVHGEIPASWPKEAIKAQVVAGRTYALFRQAKRKQNQQNRYDLEGNFADQVYVGSKGEADAKVKQTIAETQGEVLWYLGLYPAYFHSSCGGQTETVARIWGKNEVSTAVLDRFCAHSPHQHWELVLSAKDFLGELRSHGLEGSRLKSIQVERHETSPRNALVVVETNQMTLFLGANDFRRLLGYDQLKSTWFDVSYSPHTVTFHGTGYGHGVGLCQWGAKAMAETGKNYREILELYYPKALLRKIY